MTFDDDGAWIPVAFVALFTVFVVAGVSQCVRDNQHRASCKSLCEAGGKIYHSMEIKTGCLCVDAASPTQP